MEILDLIRRCIRILHIARKPTPEEFEKVARVTSVGMLVFGAMGFIISLVFGLVR